MGIPHSRPGDNAVLAALGIAGIPFIASEYLAQAILDRYQVYLPDYTWYRCLTWVFTVPWACVTSPVWLVILCYGYIQSVLGEREARERHRLLQ